MKGTVIMATKKMAASMKLMLFHFLKAPEKYATENHKKLIWRLAQKDEFDPNELMTIMDFPIPGFNSADPEAEGNFILAQMEMMFQNASMDLKIPFMDAMRDFADRRVAEREDVLEYLKSNPVVPSNAEIDMLGQKYLGDAKKELITSLIDKLANSGVDLTGLGEKLGLPPSIGDQSPNRDAEIDAWGAPPVDKRKLN